MSLHITTVGTGPDLVLLHGWGFNANIWESIIPPLSSSFSLHLVDLPGHGSSSYHHAAINASQLADFIAKHAPEHAHYLGWSMGGSVAMSLALQHPSRVNKLILVASTPCFVNHTDWDKGVEHEVFQNFGNDLTKNYHSTIKRFLTLQSLGNPQQRTQIKPLQRKLAASQQPVTEALKAGLTLLEQTDLRENCQHIKNETLIIHSDDDKLVPLAAGQYLAENIPKTEFVMLEKTGHIPFINQTNSFCQHIKRLLHA